MSILACVDTKSSIQLDTTPVWLLDCYGSEFTIWKERAAFLIFMFGHDTVDN
jgi:hypothetical protein